MQVKGYAGLASLALILIACGPSSPPAIKTPYSLGDVSNYIDANIQGKERQAIIDVLPYVDEKYRENIVISSIDGNTYVNKDSLRSKTRKYTSVSLGNNVYKFLETGEIYYGPSSSTSPSSLVSQAINCSNGQGTGPYYRATSRAGPGNSSLRYWTFSRAQVELPTSITLSSTIVNGKKVYSETPFIMLGGWGKGVNAVDAGLQYNPGTDNSIGQGTWSVFNNDKSGPIRFKRSENSSINLSFFVLSDGTTYITASGLVSGQPTTIGVPGGPGWDPNGYGNIMKRTTSIAQKTGAQNLSSGAFMSDVVWYNMFIGGATSSVNWSGNTQYNCYYPNQTKVQLSPDSLENFLEYVSIQL
jgi:hypothetical protein